MKRCCLGDLDGIGDSFRFQVERAGLCGCYVDPFRWHPVQAAYEVVVEASDEPDVFVPRLQIGSPWDCGCPWIGRRSAQRSWTSNSRRRKAGNSRKAWASVDPSMIPKNEPGTE